MRYIGGKSLLVDKIHDCILSYTDNVQSVFDIFAGSGAVTQYLLTKGYNLTANDILYFSYVLLRGGIALHGIPEFKSLGIENPIRYLNSMPVGEAGDNKEELFVYNNYAPNENCGRMYFQPHNALKIDIIRITIEKWHDDGLINDNEYFYLLASLLSAVPYVSNIAGVYAAYLKHWDKRTFNDLELKQPQVNLYNSHTCKCMNADYMSVIDTPTDLLYADPPYNSREYCPNYHILETVARYDYPEIKGVTGMRPYQNLKSPFCSRRTVETAFENLIKCCNARYVLISYNNEALLPTSRLAELCCDYAINDSFKLIEIDYRRYKSKIPNNKAGLKEQLYFMQLR